SRRWGRERFRDATRGVAGGGGFEPPLRGPEPRVLPLDDPPKSHADAQITAYGLRQVNEPRSNERAPANRSPTTAAYRTALFSARLGRKRNLGRRDLDLVARDRKSTCLNSSH